MASKEDLYVSIPIDVYRENKSNILMSQADLLSILKRLYNLKVIVRQKQDLKKKLQKLLATIITNINLIQNKIPTPKIPKVIQKEDNEKVSAKKNFSKYREIEEELREIQEKLRKLNS